MHATIFRLPRVPPFLWPGKQEYNTSCTGHPLILWWSLIAARRRQCIFSFLLPGATWIIEEGQLLHLAWIDGWIRLSCIFHLSVPLSLFFRLQSTQCLSTCKFWYSSAWLYYLHTYSSFSDRKNLKKKRFWHDDCLIGSLNSTGNCTSGQMSKGPISGS